MLPLYLMGYGTFRFFIEFFRHPDNFLGRNDLFGMSRGQSLCILMVLLGIALFVWERRREIRNSADKNSKFDAPNP